MASDKVDMSLDDIIKLNKGSRGGGRGRGRGRGRGGAVRGGRGGRGAFSVRGAGRRGASRFMGRGRGYGTGGVLRGGVQKRTRGFRQSNVTHAQVNDVWKHDLYQQAAGSFNKPRAGGDASGSGGRLLISNLDFGVNDADIQELFAEFGTLLKAAVHYDRSGRSLGTAEVSYALRQEAARAMNQYNNVPLDGRPMRIQLVGEGAGSIASRLSSPRGGQRGAGGAARGGGARPMGQRGRGFGFRNRGFGGRGRGFRGRGGRGRGNGKVPSKAELDAQLDAYNSKMDMS